MLKEFRNPIFDMGVIGGMLFLVGIFLKNSNVSAANYILWVGVGLCVLFSLISLVEVFTTHALKGQRKMFWIVIVFLVPVFGSFVYYIFNRKNESASIK